jgi:hypothetical protein
MNEQTRIVIGTLQADRKLSEQCFERIIREYVEWLGLMDLTQPQHVSDIADVLAEELAWDIEGALKVNSPVALALFRDAQMKVDWLEVARFVIPQAIQHYKELAHDN